MDLKQLPEIDPDTCLLASTTISHCRSCIDACPTTAWVLMDESLGLDTESCDGCGICIPACPTASVTIDSRPVLLLERDQLGFSCSQAANTPSLNRIACIHSIEPASLVSLYRQGMRVITAHIGTCSNCIRDTQEGFWTRLENLNNALAARGLPIITLHYFDAGHPSPQTGKQEQHDASRRGFFSKMFGRHAAGASDNGSVQDSSPSDSPGEWLASTGIAGPLPHVPVITLSACQACHACVRICPQSAIVHDILSSRYQLYAELCNGCNLCVDICEYEAITVQAWQRPGQSTFALQSRRCVACGTDFSVISENDMMKKHCHVCRSNNVLGKLYQVID